MSTEIRTHLGIQDQEKILNSLQKSIRYTPVRERLFFSHGDKMATACVMASTLVFERCGFRAFNLTKFGKARGTTLFLTLVMGANGGLIHAVFLKPSLMRFYRQENMWYYGFKSAIAHQIGLLLGSFSLTCTTFILAQRYGIIPIPHDFYRAEIRKQALKYFTTNLKPYYRLMAMTSLTSTALMFMIGLLEYKQSCSLLSKLDRKTLSYKED